MVMVHRDRLVTRFGVSSLGSHLWHACPILSWTWYSSDTVSSRLQLMLYLAGKVASDHPSPISSGISDSSRVSRPSAFSFSRAANMLWSSNCGGSPEYTSLAPLQMVTMGRVRKIYPKKVSKYEILDTPILFSVPDIFTADCLNISGVSCISYLNWFGGVLCFSGHPVFTKLKLLVVFICTLPMGSSRRKVPPHGSGWTSWTSGSRCTAEESWD